MRTFVLDRLPRRARWNICGSALDFAFLPEGLDLRQIDPGDIVGGPIPEEWAGCWVFGMYNYADGGGASPWIAVRERDGFVCGLDAEREGSAPFIFNSSLDRFISIFNLFNGHFPANQALARDTVLQARALDADAFDNSEWRMLCDLIVRT
jgi:hypothetical protein